MTSEGETVVVHFTGRIAGGEDDGEIFDTTQAEVALEAGIYDERREYEPLEFRVGADEVIPGLDEAVRGMAAGERRTVRIDPDRAFGEYRDDRVVEVPRGDVGPRATGGSAEGALFRADDGRTGWVTDVDGETATVDFNHELAGQVIELDVEVLDVSGDREPDERERK